MSHQELDPQRRLIAQRAVEWLTLLQAGELSIKERSELADWLRASPLHIDEMLRISMIDMDLGEFKNWKKYLNAAGVAGEDGFDSDHDNLITLSEFPTPVARRKWFSAPVAALAMAASLSAIAVIGGWLYIDNGQSVIRTGIGQQHQFTLADGSVVDVAPDSELRVQLKSHQRLIDLTRGQAFFHVAKDASRPFIVDAGNARVRAVGTAFNVDRGAGAVTVTVTEGRVTVTRGSLPLMAKLGFGVATAADVFVSANEQTVVAQDEVKTAVQPVDGKEATAWTEGKLIFKNEKVSEAVHRFNLYNRAQIRVLDEQLATHRVSGAFNATDPESFVAFVKITSNNLAGINLIVLDQPEN